MEESSALELDACVLVRALTAEKPLGDLIDDIWHVVHMHREVWPQFVGILLRSAGLMGENLLPLIGMLREQELLIPFITAPECPPAVMLRSVGCTPWNGTFYNQDPHTRVAH